MNVAVIAPRDEPNANRRPMNIRLITRSDDGYINGPMTN